MASPIANALAATLLLAAVSGAGELGLSFEALYASAYIWRGVELDSGRSLQPGVTLFWEASDKVGFDANVWWNLAQTEPEPGHEEALFERDLTLSGRLAPAEPWTLSVGWVDYRSPKAPRLPNGDRPRTREVFVEAGYAGKVATHAAKLSYDFGQYRGYYLDWTSTATVPLGEWLDLESSLHLGAAQGMGPNPSQPDECYYYDEDGVVDGSVGAALVTSLTPHLSLRISGVWVVRFDSDEAFGGKSKSTTWGGVTLAWSL
ncbi:MAG: hypothetical protein KA072_09275 [Thermoanaerobaculaceae bacterium]|nr:hypothetical protein [Thermoanaerobaculaceae bacterium]MDI9622103.1 hypothetical protein [Acidobacteriota bacterium]NLH11611.1 hypothetical protein [Holophagae bacterium]HPW56654.1 hypothetical protein [Thermoanaerobaculaceae bacterium]